MLCKKMDDCEEGKALEEEAKAQKQKYWLECGRYHNGNIQNPLVRDVARTATRAAMRGILGMLTKKIALRYF